MNSLQNYSGSTVDELKNIIMIQNEKLCEYEKKLKLYNDVVADRDNLLEIIKQFEQWRTKNDVERANIFTEQLTLFEAKNEKIKKITTEKCDLQSKNCELQKINNNINDQLRTLKLNENMFKLKLENSDKNAKCAQKESNDVKIELEKTNCIVRKLKINLKSIEEEICEKRKRIEEFTKTCNRLNDTNESLEADLKCTKAKLDDAKTSVKCVEEQCRLNMGTLADQLNMKCKQLDDLEIKYSEATSKLDINNGKMDTLMTTLSALKTASLKKYNKMINVTQKLKEENSAKEAELCRLKNNNKLLRRDNEFIIMGKKQEMENQLKKYTSISNEIDQIKLKLSCCQVSEKSQTDVCFSKTSMNKC